MPGLRIRDALALVKERGPDLPFIVLSGAIKDEDAVAMLDAGAQDYILKDNLSRLIPVVERELRSAQLRREREEIEKVQRENQGDQPKYAGPVEVDRDEHVIGRHGHNRGEQQRNQAQRPSSACREKRTAPASHAANCTSAPGAGQ